MFFNPLMLSSTGIVDSVLEIFTAIGTWFVTMITGMLPIFYSAETGLTIIGVLTCCGLGVSVILLVVGFVRNFFHWR